MKNIIYFIIAASLTSCVSVEKLSRDINQRYTGKNFDEFVLKYGTPKDKYQLSSGDIAYTWNSGTRTISAPGVATTTFNGNYATTQHIGGGDVSMFCELQIVTDSTNTVKSLKIMKDTIGWVTDSQCYDILSK